LQSYDEAHKGSTVHVGEHLFRVFSRDGVWHAEGNVDGKRHRFSASTRDGVLGTAMRAVQHAYPKFRELSDDEALHVARLAQSGDEPSAFGQYFLSRIGPHVATMEDPMTELLSNPKYRALCDEAAFFVWAARNDNYVTNAEFERMVAHVAESKPLNGRLITSVWIQYLDEKQNRLLNPKPEEPAETEPDPREINAELNELDDGSIDHLMRATQRQYAREVRAGSR
jgi:hypothetical protein